MQIATQKRDYEYKGEGWKDGYAYTEWFDQVEEKSTTILEQKIAYLDLKSVILAINGIK